MPCLWYLCQQYMTESKFGYSKWHLFRSCIVSWSLF